MSPDEYCLAKVGPHRSSFYYSLLGLPPRQRRGLIALQAFCHEVDAVVRACREESVARTTLGWWRQEVRGLFEGRSQHPVTRALAPHLEPAGLAPEYFAEVIDGAEMDLDRGLYPSFRELSLYCHRRGSMPGLMASQLLGYEDRQTARFAHELGMALVLLRILRDLGRDLREGRIFVPGDELERFGLSAGALHRVPDASRLRPLLEHQARRIRDTHRRALELLPAGERRSQASRVVLGELAMALLDEIEADGFAVLERRITLTPLRKLWLAWRVRRRESRRR